MIIDELAWCRFDMQLRGNWIDWLNPHFVGQYEDDWRPLLSMLKDAGDLPAELGRGDSRGRFGADIPAESCVRVYT